MKTNKKTLAALGVLVVLVTLVLSPLSARSPLPGTGEPNEPTYYKKWDSPIFTHVQAYVMDCEHHFGSDTLATRLEISDSSSCKINTYIPLSREEMLELLATDSLIYEEDTSTFFYNKDSNRYETFRTGTGKFYDLFGNPLPD